MPQAEDNASPEDPDSRHNRHKHGGTAPVMWRCTRYVALHPLRGTAPVMWRCTRTEEVHCLRIGCSAPTNKNKRGTGPPNHSPPHPSMRTWALLAAGRARRPRHHLHPGPLRHLPHPYMRRALKPPDPRRDPGPGRVDHLHDHTPVTLCDSAHNQGSPQAGCTTQHRAPGPQGCEPRSSPSKPTSRSPRSQRSSDAQQQVG